MYVCICYAVSERDVLEAVQCGAHTPEAVAERTGASTGCGNCLERLCARVALASPPVLVDAGRRAHEFVA